MQDHTTTPRLFSPLFCMALAASAATLTLCATAQNAVAADSLIPGNKLDVQDKRSLRDGVAKLKRAVSYRGRGQAVQVPAAGSAGDPTMHGGSLTIINTAGTSESVTIDLPAAGWKGKTSSGQGQSWTYKTRTPKVQVTLRNGDVKVKAQAKLDSHLPFTLDEASQGSLAVTLELGGDRLCSAFGGAAGGDIRSDLGNVDASCGTAGRFSAKGSAAPSACTDPSGGAGVIRQGACSEMELLDLLINGQMSKTGIAGMAVGIVTGGQPAWTRGYGMADVSASRAVTADTPFMLASISKVFTGTAAMMLIEDGDLSLTTPVNSVLNFNIDNPKVSGESINIFHLLTHSSGIDDWCVWGDIDEPGGPIVSGDSPIALGTYMRDCLTPGTVDYDEHFTWRNFQPGQGYYYSNIGNALLGYAVERSVTGSFDDWCDANIFDALGMTNTGWHLADHNVSELAVPYSWGGGSFDAYPHYGFPDYPNGQLRTSVNSLAKFLATIAGGGILDSTRILDATTVDTMLTPALPGVESSQALAWYYETIAGRSVVGHNGGEAGVSTEMWLDRDTGVGIIVLTNVDETSASAKAVKRIQEALFALGEGGTL